MTNDIDTARYQKMIELGQLSLKTLVLINCGAAVALLALIGGIWTSGIEKCVANLLNYRNWCFRSRCVIWRNSRIFSFQHSIL